MPQLRMLVVGLAFLLGTPAQAQMLSLETLLMSGPWCSFRYNATTGNSSESRVVFRGDGTWSTGRRSDGWSSGYGGTMASSSAGSAGGRWHVQQGMLFMSEGAGAMEFVNLRLSANSSGAPVITADGVEHVRCN